MLVLFIVAKPYFQLLGCFDRVWNSAFPSILSSPQFSVYFLLDTNKTHWQLHKITTHALDPLVLRPCTWEQKTSALHGISPCTEKDQPRFRSPWTWSCLTVRVWMSKVTVKWGSFLCLLVYADIHLACSSQFCPLQKDFCKKSWCSSSEDSS